MMKLSIKRVNMSNAIKASSFAKGDGWQEP
jgi:hypothetical protein